MVRLKFGPTLLEPRSPHRQPPLDIAGCNGVRIGHVAAPRLRRCKTCGLLSKVQSVDQRMRLGMRCRLSPTADVPSHTSGAVCAITGSDEPYSITSSALPSSIGGISRPSAFAVLRLMSSANWVYR